MTDVGIPYAPVDPATGDRTCPVCGLVIGEAYDDDGECETNRYGEHYEAEHAGPLTFDDRQSLRGAVAALQQQGAQPDAIVRTLRMRGVVRASERDAVEAYVRWVLDE